MWAYIYFPGSRKYGIVETTKIPNLVVEKTGVQNAQFSAKSFEYSSGRGKMSSCQVLIVEDEKESVDAHLAEFKPLAPRIKGSEVPMGPANHYTSETQQTHTVGGMKATRANMRNQQRNGMMNSDNNIIKGASSSRTSTQDGAKTGGVQNPKFATKRKPTIKSEKDYSSSDESDVNDDDNVSSAKQRKLMRDLRLVREMYMEAEQQTKQLLQINEKLTKDHEQLKKELAQVQIVPNVNHPGPSTSSMATRSSTSSNRFGIQQWSDTLIPNSTEVLPVFTTTSSGITAREDYVERAYDQFEPSRFYANMCYATWGHKELAKRCVKKEVRTRNKKELTPKRKKAIRKHLEYFLDSHNYPTLLKKYHLKSINNYAHVAIANAKQYMKRHHPPKDDDEFSSEDSGEDLDRVEL